MSNIEILWNHDKTRDFLGDLKAFASSLDFYQIIINVETPDEDHSVIVGDSTYKILSSETAECFNCPERSNERFDILEGEFQDKPVLGLACVKCETYGAIFPQGL